MLYKVVVGLLLIAAATLPEAVSAAENRDLDFFLRDVQRMTAKFSQKQLDGDGELLAESQGQVWIERPNRFRWAYEQPYEQLVLCDGGSIWIYDPDLEQVTQRAAGPALNGTPAALLSQGADALKGFQVETIGEEEFTSTVRLVPESNEGDFSSIELSFNRGMPERLVFVDALGGTTRIELTDLSRNPEIGAEVFRFEVPDGVEVVNATGSGSE